MSRLSEAHYEKLGVATGRFLNPTEPVNNRRESGAYLATTSTRGNGVVVGFDRQRTTTFETIGPSCASERRKPPSAPIIILGFEYSWVGKSTATR